MVVRMTLPPGPKGHPVIGSFLAYRADPLAFFDSLRDYGFVTRIRVMGHEFCVVSHPDPTEEVLVTKARSFRKSKDYREGLAFLGNGLLNSEGDFWLRQRRLEQPAFHRARVHAYGETMVAYAERLLEDVAGRRRTRRSQGHDARDARDCHQNAFRRGTLPTGPRRWRRRWSSLWSIP